MEPSKNPMLLLFEEKYGSKFGFGTTLNRQEFEDQLTSGKGKRKNELLNTIKKMVKFEHPAAGFPTTGSAFVRKWRSLQKIGTPKSDRDEESEKENSGKGCSEVQWWDPPQDSLPVEFCQDTSLHGLKYIGQRQRHISERIFWFLMFVVGLSIAIWLISEMWIKYKQNPVIVSFQPFETNVDQVPFPAVTVCNMNKVMKSRAKAFLDAKEAGDEQARKDVYYLNHVCTSSQSFSRRFNFSSEKFPVVEESDEFAKNLTRVNGFLRRAAQNCTEMIRLCVWHDQNIDCSEIFRPIETEFGKCCTFNMVPLSLLYTRRNDSRESAEEIHQWEKWDIDQDGLLLTTSPEETKFPRRQIKAGLTNGLSFLLNVDSSEYYCTSSDSVGFRMATHLPVELPKIADFGISLRPKAEIFVDVLPQITMVDQDVFSFALNKRKCYKAGEFKLAHYKYYSVNNCINECIANQTKLTCGCKRYFMPRTVDERLCGPRNFECAESVKYNKTRGGIRNTCPMCYQSCTEVDYEPQTTATPLMNGIWKYENETSPEWNEDDLTIVHVYIGQDSFYAKVRKELFGPLDLFANTGGLMGLCLGFSALSLIEVVYFLTLRACWKSKRNRVVECEDESNTKWATPRSTPVPTPETFLQERKISCQSMEEQAKPTAYYRSIFGELRPLQKR